MKIQHFLLGILIAGSFVLGLTLFAGDLRNTSGIPINTSFNDTYDTTDEILELSNAATDQLTTGPIVAEETDEGLERSGFSIIKAVSFTTNSFSLINGIILDTFASFGIGVFGYIIITIIAILLLFAIIAALFGRNV